MRRKEKWLKSSRNWTEAQFTWQESRSMDKSSSQTKVRFNQALFSQFEIKILQLEKGPFILRSIFVDLWSQSSFRRTRWENCLGFSTVSLRVFCESKQGDGATDLWTPAVGKRSSKRHYRNWFLHGNVFSNWKFLNSKKTSNRIKLV